MKEIKIKENIYVLKKDAELEINKAKSSHIPQIKDTTNLILNNINTIGMGHTTLKKGHWIYSEISLLHLSTVLQTFKSFYKKWKDENIHIMWSDNAPLMFGKFNKKTNMFSGLIVAPKITND